VLRTDPKTLDAKFDAYVKQRFARILAAIDPVTERVPDSSATPGAGRGGRPRATATADRGEYATLEREAATLYAERKLDDAIPVLQKMKAIFPEYAGSQNSSYWALARIYLAKHDTAKATAELRELVGRNESDYESTMMLADLLTKAGDARGAAAALDRAMYISPGDAKAHTSLAALASQIGDRKLAVRERAAIVALAPVDEAEARYQLALAYFEAGDVAAARREVLRALEAAPNFERAQQLLLKLRGSSGAGHDGGGDR
jgi:tetratricopeptide (TPR) repeat protein